MAIELAQAAYEAYASEDGRPASLPWDRIPPKTQERWRRAVRATLEAHAGAGAVSVEPGTADGENRFG